LKKSIYSPVGFAENFGEGWIVKNGVILMEYLYAKNTQVFRIGTVEYLK